MRRRNERGNWETGVAELPPPTFEVVFDRSRLERISHSFDRVAQSWEVRLVALAPIAGDGKEPGFWGRLLLCVDQKSGFVLPCGVLGPDESVQDAFLNAVEGAGFIPERLRLTSSLLEQQLSPLTRAFSIKVQQVAKLPKLDEASASLTMRFR